MPRSFDLVDVLAPRQVNCPILVVEDDPQARVVFQLLLQGERYPVVTAADGLDAARCISALRPSLVLLDLDLPLLDGRAVTPTPARLRGRVADDCCRRDESSC